MTCFTKREVLKWLGKNALAGNLTIWCDDVMIVWMLLLIALFTSCSSCVFSPVCVQLIKTLKQPSECNVKINMQNLPPHQSHVFMILYSPDQMPQLLFFSSINFVQLLFKSGDYLRAAFSSFSQSLWWRRREQRSIEWLLDRQGNVLVVADWFTSLFCVCFASSQWVFMCACATQIFVAPIATTIRE